MGDLPKPRPTYVLVRGNYDDHGEQIPPRGLNEVLPWNPAWPENRLGLAQWLFDSKNPLTSRVYVNRAWQSHFGRGLVETAEDFGSQGSLPDQSGAARLPGGHLPGIRLGHQEAAQADRDVGYVSPAVGRQ